MIGISRKIYLEMTPPSAEDARSAQQRLLGALGKETVRLPLKVLQTLQPVCETSGWSVTASLAWDGACWEATGLEAGNTSRQHYGYAADLGSTRVVMRLVDCCSGAVVAEESTDNRQIAWGTDILSRIFACKEQPQTLRAIAQATRETLLALFDRLQEETGIAPEDCISMTVSGNTTMIHFLLGLDPFCVFAAPYAVCADRPGFLRASELELPLPGYVFCVPGKSNYLGGDIISGMIETQLYQKDGIRVFFDIGTNGELVIGGRDFLLCAAGAAGPALEGGVVRTGMRAEPGAVDAVELREGKLFCHTIGEAPPRGICGSGIIDLIAALFLAGWIDLRGKLQERAADCIGLHEGELACEYVPGLLFWQRDIDEFLRTKAAAYTMVEYLLREAGIPMEEISGFYAAGAFGAHVNVESAVTIGMYPDLPRDRLIPAGNTSLAGAQRLLLNLELHEELGEILEKMVYVQLGEAGDFLTDMLAAQAIPHTDLSRFPSVVAKMKKR